VSEALTCPFCRESLAGSTYACARAGCGALYHEACWLELGREHGGCAIMGCGSSAARPLGSLGRAWRRARVTGAAVFFSRGLVQALRATDGQGVGAVLAYARETARRYLPGWKPLPGLRGRFGGSVTGPVIAANPLAVIALFVLGFPVFFVAVVVPFLASLLLANALHLRPGAEVEAMVGGVVLSLVSAYFVGSYLPAIVAFPLAAVFYVLRGVARLLGNEVAALGRVDVHAAPRVERRPRGPEKA
jgi:hypothetical protein